jgi:hypothetical protein
VEAWAFGVRSDGSRDQQQLLLPGSPLTTPDGYLAPGVVHQATADPAGPFAVNLVTVELAAPSRIDIALALDVLPGQETTSSMARRRGGGPVGVRADGWAETTYAVEVVGQLGGPVPAGTVVLSTPAAGAAAPPWPRATRSPWPGPSPPGRGSWRPAAATPPWSATARVLSGNVDGTTPFHRRNPQTAVGATADGKLLIVTVDGRQPGHSVGMSLREVSDSRSGGCRAPCWPV